MKFSPARYLLSLLPALVLSTRQDYEELERQLKEVFKERSTILYQLARTSKELDGIKNNLRSLKNEEKYSKTNVEKLLEIGEKQREQMKTLQETLQSQLKESSEKANKQQVTINFLKNEVERKNKIIRDLQSENKSLKNKLLSGNKVCGLHAEESKKIQAQLKELRYGKKDLLVKAQQLTELEQKLAAAKRELEKAALDKESQMKAMKEMIRLCLSGVFQDQPSPYTVSKSTPSQMSAPHKEMESAAQDASTSEQPQEYRAENNEASEVGSSVQQNPNLVACDSENNDTNCSPKQGYVLSNSTSKSETALQKLQIPPCTECKMEKNQEKQLTSFEGRATREDKIL
ncbi:PREDICTED: leucine zipper protein 2 [Condylura cristata]|uniref:leucine zipper protein 2 n=1 Tax=Condylura cristata TaxID=143302 RepID=UPI0006438A2F|nr:PREDICTED: leucine zipper protein 2 [Condylura cristata]